MRGDLYPKDSWDPAMLLRIERDADIDAALLSICWRKLADAAATHPLKDLCRDLVCVHRKSGTASSWI